MSHPLILSALWSILLLGLVLLLPRLISFLKPHDVRYAWVLILCVAAISRLVPNALLHKGAGYDIESYQIVADTVLNRQDVYSNPDAGSRHPYLPLQMYWLAVSRWLTERFSLPFATVVRIAPILADILIAVTLYFLLMKRAPSVAFFGGMLYALNPIPIYVSAYHGQFDSIPALFILLAIYWLSRSSWMTGGMLGIGILVKSWPVLAFPALFFGTKLWRGRLKVAFLAIAIPLAGVGVYLYFFDGSPLLIFNKALTYNWGIGVWGYGYLVRLLTIALPDFNPLLGKLLLYGRQITIAILAITWWFRARKQKPEAEILTILVTFIAWTHAFSIQYLMWVVPFAVLNMDFRWLKYYTVGAFFYMFLVYNTLILELHITSILPWPQADWFLIMPAGLPAWIIAVLWARERLSYKNIKA